MFIDSVGSQGSEFENENESLFFSFSSLTPVNIL